MPLPTFHSVISPRLDPIVFTMTGIMAYFIREKEMVEDQRLFSLLKRRMNSIKHE
jgi:hypothetical protein